MSILHPKKGTGLLGGSRADEVPEPSRRGRGRWVMIACCVPILVIAIVLVATGVGGVGLIVAALCIGAMATMMMLARSSGNEQ